MSAVVGAEVSAVVGARREALAVALVVELAVKGRLALLVVRRELLDTARIQSLLHKDGGASRYIDSDSKTAPPTCLSDEAQAVGPCRPHA